MSNYARWERESQERLDMPPARGDETAEFDVTTTFDRDASADEAATDAQDSPLTTARQSVAETAARVGRWFAGLERREFEPDDAERDPVAELTAGGIPTVPRTARRRRAARAEAGAFFPESEPESEPEADADGPYAAAELDAGPADGAGLDGAVVNGAPEDGDDAARPAPPAAGPRREDGPGDPSDSDGARFPTAPLGYNRQAVDHVVAALEREVADLRGRIDPPISITEEIERIGEQTASILVVAHDKAHETTRLAQEQAERCVQDAASNAVAITAEAKRRLRELDEETDAVWRERERLLEDVRVVSTALATLAEDASERFPADAKAHAEVAEAE